MDELTSTCGTEILKKGADPLALIGYLTTLGEIVSIETLVSRCAHTEEQRAHSCSRVLETQ